MISLQRIFEKIKTQRIVIKYSLLIEIAYRLLLQKGFRQIGLTGWVSFVGLMLGVGCLVVSMAVVSGFESTLRDAIVNASGHIRIMRSNGISESDSQDLFKKILKNSEVASSAAFLSVEAIAAEKGKVFGVLAQGFHQEEFSKVLKLKDRLLSGNLNLATNVQDIPPIVIGKVLADRMALKVGGRLRLVVPQSSDLDPTRFQRKLQSFQIVGILNFGKIEYDERLVLTNLSTLQSLAQVGSKTSGFVLNLKNIEQTNPVAYQLSRELGPLYQIYTWRENNENMLEAIRIEKVVIFFVILIIVIAAAFNVSSSLFVSIMQRYPDIAILKSLGLSPQKVIQVFSIQGLLLGFIGCIGGIIFGFILCGIFVFLQTQVSLLPGSVYKLDHIDVAIRFFDLFVILVVTLLICFVAALAPAVLGARLSPVDGLRYE